MKETFSPRLRLSADNKKRLELINSILEEYQSDGYVLTLRQLYYQLVSRDVIPNQDKEYKKLGVLLTEGRMAGIVDWDIIEDRVRKPYLPYYTTNAASAVNDVLSQFRIDRMQGQPNYIEVFVEKDALSGVLKRVTEKYHIRLMVNRGYSSTTAMYDTYKRFMQALRDEDTERVIIAYLGDHDPSGLDMIRDVQDRVLEMLEVGYDKDVNWRHHRRGDDRAVEWDMIQKLIRDKFEVIPIALTTEQVEEYDPPPNPAKMSDSRADEYVKKHGYVSWEVDALNPKTLNSILSNQLEELLDMDIYHDVLAKEAGYREKLKEFAKSLEKESDDD